jgi:HSP20 family protein
MSASLWGRRWDPLHDLQREVHRLFDTLEPVPGWRVPRPYPPLNLYEAEDRYILSAEMPGVSPDEIELSLTGETLTLRGERKRPEGVAEDQYRRQERVHGRWSRSVTLPQRVDASAVTANCSGGILTIELPKAEESRPRQIAVTGNPETPLITQRTAP